MVFEASEVTFAVLEDVTMSVVWPVVSVMMAGSYGAVRVAVRPSSAIESVEVILCALTSCTRSLGRR